jgi:hypothetical protein
MRSTFIAVAVAVAACFQLGLAADCTTQANFASAESFDLTDAQTLQQNIVSDNFNPPLNFPIPAQSTSHSTLSFGSATACIENQFLFENTHLAQSDVAFAIQDIIDQCGGQYPFFGYVNLLPLLL